jgi:YegS/Rv2252/BmrU family lipid kinase
VKRVAVIINPVAGAGLGGAVDAAASLATRVIGAGGEVDVAVSVTRAPADAARLAREAREGGASLVVAWGGDGTINGVAAALVHSDIPLGIVPAGSGNGLARDLGLPLDARAALEVAIRGRERTMDAGELNGSLFFNVAGVGLDAEIARRLADPRARRGLAGYIMATLQEWPRYRPRAYSLRMDSHQWSGRALFIALANSRQYGNGAQIAPRARLDDGRIDVVAVEAQPFIRVMPRIPAFFRGTLSEAPGLRMWQCQRLELQAEDSVHFHVDGEPREGPAELRLAIHSRALRVRIAA